jgi:hypothetical protein
LVEVAPGIGEEHCPVDPSDSSPIPRLTSQRAAAEVYERDGVRPAKPLFPSEPLFEALGIRFRLVVEQPLEEETQRRPLCVGVADDAPHTVEVDDALGVWLQVNHDGLRVRITANPNQEIMFVHVPAARFLSALLADEWGYSAGLGSKPDLADELIDGVTRFIG